jgi:hypothetical protein
MRWTSTPLNVYPPKNDLTTLRKGYVSFATNLDIVFNTQERRIFDDTSKLPTKTTYQKIRAIMDKLDEEEKDEIATQMEKEGF